MTPADEDGWVTGIKPGYRTKTMKIGNCTATVHRPILNDQERARAEEKVREALRGLIKKGVYR